MFLIDGPRVKLSAPDSNRGCLSSDGANLYAGARWGNAVAVFDRAGEGICAATGAGDVLSETFDLAAGGSLTLEVTGTVAAQATGLLTNTATVTGPGGFTDPVPGNNDDDDLTTIEVLSDLAVTKGGKDKGLRKLLRAMTVA